jgi:hypothetical protein
MIQERLNTRISEIREKYKEPVPEKERDRKYREHVQRQQFEGGFNRRGGEGGPRRFGGPGRDKRDVRKKKDRRKRFGKRRY